MSSYLSDDKLAEAAGDDVLRGLGGTVSDLGHSHSATVTSSDTVIDTLRLPPRGSDTHKAVALEPDERLRPLPHGPGGLLSRLDSNHSARGKMYGTTDISRRMHVERDVTQNRYTGILTCSDRGQDSNKIEQIFFGRVPVATKQADEFTQEEARKTPEVRVAIGLPHKDGGLSE